MNKVPTAGAHIPSMVRLRVTILTKAPFIVHLSFELAISYQLHTDIRGSISEMMPMKSLPEDLCPEIIAIWQSINICGDGIRVISSVKTSLISYSQESRSLFNELSCTTFMSLKLEPIICHYPILFSHPHTVTSHSKLSLSRTETHLSHLCTPSALFSDWLIGGPLYMLIELIWKWRKVLNVSLWGQVWFWFVFLLSVSFCWLKLVAKSTENIWPLEFQKFLLA